MHQRNTKTVPNVNTTDRPKRREFVRQAAALGATVAATGVEHILSVGGGSAAVGR